jgi:hypothetical protein
MPYYLIQAIPVFLLSCPEALDALVRCCQTHGPDDETEQKEVLRKACFLRFKNTYPSFPDHVFAGQWEFFERSRQAKPWVMHALDCIGEYFFERRQKRVHIKSERFAEWQDHLSRIAPGGVIACYVARHTEAEDLTPERLRKCVKRYFSNTTILFPWDPLVEEYVEREGLHEAHMHLNGSTEIDIAWQHTMENRGNVLKEISSAYQKKKQVVSELFETIYPGLDVQRLGLWFEQARHIQCVLVPGMANGGASEINQVYEWIFLNRVEPPLGVPRWKDHTGELCYMAVQMAEQEKGKSRIKSRFFALLHYYLLIKNLTAQLLIQRDDMFGFDEFQKITLQGAREDQEKYYFQRFMQFHGNQEHSEAGYFEGRVAPKTDAKKLDDLVRHLLEGLKQYQKKYNAQGRRGQKAKTGRAKASRLRPVFVFHFIKGHSDHGVFRAPGVRVEMDRTMHAITALMNRPGTSLCLFRGIDAAANELHTAPEAFACTFRRMRTLGIGHQTYHVGEDFKHLISGMRAIHNTVKYLDMGQYDRLGHCTAIGIDPRVWLASVPQKLIMSQEEWLDDLLFIRRHLRLMDNHLKAKIDDDIDRHLQDLYKDTDETITRDGYERVRGLCGLNPHFVRMHAAEERNDFSDESTYREYEYTNKALKQVSKKTVKRLLDWFDDKDLAKAAVKNVAVDAKYLEWENLVQLQQHIMNELIQKRIVIETLPTSNVRIAPYNTMGDHHIFRWMGLPGRKLAGDPDDLLVCLGSDDPGIFSTNMKSEFYHIYLQLQSTFRMKPEEALRMTAVLNERGRSYGFHEK